MQRRGEFRVSVSKGKCGPCCSVEPSASTAVRSPCARAAAISGHATSASATGGATAAGAGSGSVGATVKS